VEAMSRGARRGALTAAVFALAAIGGAVGNHLSHRLDAAAISFLVLLVLGAGAAVWLDRLSSNSTPNPSKPQTLSAPKFEVRMKRADRTQIGDHNVIGKNAEAQVSPSSYEFRRTGLGTSEPKYKLRIKSGDQIQIGDYNQQDNH
jgi:hypothetical protein